MYIDPFLKKNTLDIDKSDTLFMDDLTTYVVIIFHTV